MVSGEVVGYGCNLEEGTQTREEVFNQPSVSVAEKLEACELRGGI